MGAAGNLFVLKFQIQRENSRGMVNRFRWQRGCVGGVSSHCNLVFASLCSGTAKLALSVVFNLKG